jgi:hypothetical protein
MVLEENMRVGDLETIVGAMTKMRVTHIEIPISGRDKPLVIDLSPDAWRPWPEAKETLDALTTDHQARQAIEVKDEPEARCPCGHDPDTEHSDAGCLHGCPDDLCHSKDKEETAA